MFRWLARVLYGRGHIELIEGLNEGWVPPNQLSRVASRTDELLRGFLEMEDTYWRDRDKKHRLEMELQNSEWVLDYEKRLAALQKQTASQRSKAEQVGATTERLRKLEHHLAGVRRNISLD